MLNFLFYLKKKGKTKHKGFGTWKRRRRPRNIEAYGIHVCSGAPSNHPRSRCTKSQNIFRITKADKTPIVRDKLERESKLLRKWRLCISLTAPSQWSCWGLHSPLSSPILVSAIGEPLNLQLQLASLPKLLCSNSRSIEDASSLRPRQFRCWSLRYLDLNSWPGPKKPCRSGKEFTSL